MKIKKLCILLGVALALALMGTSTPAAAAVLNETAKCTEDLEFLPTTMEWDCYFEKLNYKKGDTLTLKIDWGVTGGPGSISYNGVSTRGKVFTPRGSDSAEGTSGVSQTNPNWVKVDVTFSDLHTALDENVAIGNFHLHLHLLIDDDGDALTPDIPAKFGVNLHVEDPLPEG